MKALNPYAWLGGVLIIAVLIGGGWLWGHKDVPKLEAAVGQLADERDALAIERDNVRNALGIANQGLADAANTFRAISAQAALDAARGELEVAAATRAAAEAVKSRAELQAAITEIERQLQAERETCVDASRPVCGVPLE